VQVTVRLLGGFEVVVGSTPVPAEAWSRRQAAALVKLLALAEHRRLRREQVIDALWRGLSVDAAAPRLHKAAHYARKALGDEPGTLLLRQDAVVLLPDAEVRVDVDEFRRLAALARTTRDAQAAEAALRTYGGDLLPEDAYEAWTEPIRSELRLAHLELLRLTGRWEDLLRHEPTDEGAHVALAREYADRGDARGALRQLERLEHALRRELGTSPGDDARRLRATLETPGPPQVPRQGHPGGVRLVARRETGDVVRARLDRALTGLGGLLVLVGPAGVGKTALVELAEALARTRGLRTGRGSAAAVEGPWPYAPVLEALGDLCRRHPALLDGLDDRYRSEIERAMSGREMSWSGESGHQRLFVAAAELMRLAAAGHGLLLSVDDVHEADEASMRLLHYLVRCAWTEPVLVLMAGRPLPGTPAQPIVDSLVARDPGSLLEVTPLPERAMLRLLAQRHPEVPTDVATDIAHVSGGLPFTALEMARRHQAGGTGGLLPPLPHDVLRTLRRLALLGTTFTTDELIALCDGPAEDAYRQLEIATSALLVEADTAGHRFRHPLLREALTEQMPSYELLAERREVAARLSELGGPPARVALLHLDAGQPDRAVPFVVRAVETAGALGAYRDALGLVDRVVDRAGPGERPHLLARRGDLLMAVGDPEALDAYRAALPVTDGTEHRLVRARMARTATFSGDLDTARAALLGLELEGDTADVPILMGRGNLAYVSGEIDVAWEVAGQARDLLDLGGDQWQLIDLVSLQGLIAHRRGEWFERFRIEMRRTRGKESLAVTVFDAHLCVAEYLLYGSVPYAEVIAETEELRRRATRAGALRGVAFATALIGEAALLTGDLDLAERELVESVELHRDIDATGGEAHSLQRLAEARLARGRRDEASGLLQRALPLARWSIASMHLLQRIYGTMIVAAPDPWTARDVVAQAEATLGVQDQCPLCDVMLAAPAAIACADVGDLDDARRHLHVAEESAAHWAGTAWEASVLEARAHLASAEGRTADATRLRDRAAALFATAGQVLDARRCRSWNPATRPVVASPA
jgi:DNA-binding SARP family transcriptional activator